MVKREFRIFVEGGARGDLKRRCREGFSKFFEKSGLKGNMPRVVACGSRRHAYDDFCVAFSKAKPGDIIVLLVDSEASINCGEDQVWGHVYLREGDKWSRPNSAKAEHLHFMVECMEAWFMADKSCLEAYFGQGFEANQLPPQSDIEKIAKTDLYEGLKNATKKCKTKTSYGKGTHSFDILGRIDPAKVIAASPYAKRLIDTLTYQDYIIRDASICEGEPVLQGSSVTVQAILDRHGHGMTITEILNHFSELKMNKSLVRAAIAYATFGSK